jgi:quinol monooxygenase YgiN
LKKNGGGQVAIAIMLDLPGVTEAQYAAAREVLGVAPPPGNLVHVAGPTAHGWRVVEVWKSSALMTSYFQSPVTQTAFQSAGIRAVRPAIFPDTAIAAAVSASW